MPLNYWMVNDLRDLVCDILLDSRTLNRGYFNKSYIKDLVDRFYKDQNVSYTKLWMLMVFEMWNRIFIDGELEAEACGSRYLIKFVSTLRNWWHEFLNYFDERVTQGFVEGINRAIRGIINRAFGFHVFSNFRLQVLVEKSQIALLSF